MSDEHGRFAAGTHITSGKDLMAHFRAGGFIQVDGREKWYRATANRQEVLYGNRYQWEPSSWDFDDMVSYMHCVACLEPRLSKDIRARDELNDRVAAETGCARPGILPGIPVQAQAQPAPNFWQPISFAEAMHAILLGATVTRIGELPVHIYASINGEHVVRRVARSGWARVILTVDMIQAKWKVINQFDKDYIDRSISPEWDGK